MVMSSPPRSSSRIVLEIVSLTCVIGFVLITIGISGGRNIPLACTGLAVVLGSQSVGIKSLVTARRAKRQNAA